MKKQKARTLFVAVTLLLGPLSAQAGCGGGAGFSRWLDKFREEAAAQGISSRALSALDTVQYDRSVIGADRAQGVFAQNFLQFSDRMASGYRITRGGQLLRKYKPVFDRIQKDFGVPGPVVVALWGLETDFGANMGKNRTLQALATLAYDCRRSQQFHDELLAALKLIDRGDLTASEMIGAWAGELGQTQFVPSDYLADAVDYDGDGKRNLIRSVPDVLASTANLLHSHGWQAGQPWLEEVRVPAKMAWEEADPDVRKSRAQWAASGVTLAGGGALPTDNMQASLLLPMGRLGPAFLAYLNFSVFMQWNRSTVYATTAAYLATRIAGAPVLRRGSAPVLNSEGIKEVQRQLHSKGYDVGETDGALGAQTRAAVRNAQQQLGLPADGWPDADFPGALRHGEVKAPKSPFD